LQLHRLSGFLGGIKSPEKFKEIGELKKQGQSLDKKDAAGDFHPAMRSRP